MIHQDRAELRTRERERDQTHSYCYIPSAPRVNYSLLIMESAGMMKMATGEGSPLRQGAGTGSRLVLVATEVCGGGTPDLFCSPKVLGYIGIYRRKKYVRGGHEGPTRVEGAPRGWARPPASCLPRCFPYVHPKSSGLLPFQNNFPEGFIPFGVCLIFLFCETLK